MNKNSHAKKKILLLSLFILGMGGYESIQANPLENLDLGISMEGLDLEGYRHSPISKETYFSRGGKDSSDRIRPDGISPTP